MDLRILKHEANYLVAELLYESSELSCRTGVVSHVEFEWIRRICPELWLSRPPETFSAAEQGSVSLYLDALFGR